MHAAQINAAVVHNLASYGRATLAFHDVHPVLHEQDICAGYHNNLDGCQKVGSACIPATSSLGQQGGKAQGRCHDDIRL
jgi:hypothetical protein